MHGILSIRIVPSKIFNICRKPAFSASKNQQSTRLKATIIWTFGWKTCTVTLIQKSSQQFAGSCHLFENEKTTGICYWILSWDHLQYLSYYSWHIRSAQVQLSAQIIRYCAHVLIGNVIQGIHLNFIIHHGQTYPNLLCQKEGQEGALARLL